MPAKSYALTTVWGDEYIKRFLKGTLRSLSFPSNNEAMKEVIWNIFTDDDKFEEIDLEIQKILPDTKVNLKSLSVIRDRIDYLHSALVWQIKECIENKGKLLLIPPDSLFGDKTVKNLIETGKEPNVCVFLAHPRVHPSVLDEEFSSNESLVSKAWLHLHRSWSDAEDGSERQNSHIGGVSWREIEKGLYEVKHLLPTPYYMDFNLTDLQFFEAAPGIGVIDHVWPSQLVNQKRIKYIPNSDVGFIVELTDHDKNLPPVARGENANQFWRSHPHNNFFEQTRAIFRGKNAST